MVDIINDGFRVDKLDKVLDDFDNIFFRKHSDIHVGGEVQLTVDSVTSYVTQVISLLREEQVVDDLTCTGIISRVSITQLTINVQDGFLLRVARVFLERIEDDGVVRLVSLFLMNQHRGYARFDDFINVLLFQDGLTVNDDLVTFNGNHLAGIFVYKVFHPCLQYTSSQLTPNIFL